MFIRVMLLLAVAVFVAACANQKKDISIQSPDNQVVVEYELSPLGEPVYTVLFKKDTVIKPSKLGVELKNS
ncbi:MAG: hypothetical protein C0599_13910, partial [Salinivirgaceae bacterium]